MIAKHGIGKEKDFASALNQLALQSLPEISGQFLNEGAVALPDGFAFVNIYHAGVFDRSQFAQEKGSTVHVIDSDNFAVQTYAPPDRNICITSVLPTLSDDLLLITTNKGIYQLNCLTEEWKLWHLPPFVAEWPENTRPNDCRIDPEGHLLMSWMGEHAYRHSPEARRAELWRITPGWKCDLVLNNLFIPNGHVFVPIEGQPDRYHIYFNDTARETRSKQTEDGILRIRSIDRYIYNAKNGTANRDNSLNARGETGIFLELEADNSYPDGMAYANGMLFIPMFNGGRVNVIDIAKRRVVGSIPVPNAPQVTSSDKS